jgi:hypothetical protein
LTTRNDEFNATLVESMDDAIRSLLSQEVVEAFHTTLSAKRSINLEDIPDQLPTVSTILRKYFGPSADTIEKTIVQRLYSKYGLEFQRNEDCQLTDYVENASNMLKSVPSSPEPRLQPASRPLALKGDFNRLLVESVKEAMEDALGKDSAELAFRIIEQDVTFDKLPNRLPTFYSSLNKIFGKARAAMEAAIARKLYLNLSLEFTETPNIELARYIEQAIIKLNQREQQGFNISTKTKEHSG